MFLQQFVETYWESNCIWQIFYSTQTLDLQPSIQLFCPFQPISTLSAAGKVIWTCLMGRESLFSPDTWCQLHYFCNIIRGNPPRNRDRTPKISVQKVFSSVQLQVLETGGWKGKVLVAWLHSQMVLLSLYSVDSNANILLIEGDAKAMSKKSRKRWRNVRQLLWPALCSVFDGSKKTLT